MARRTRYLTTFSLVVALTSGMARAQEPTGSSATPTATPPAKRTVTSARRPMFIGLLAAVFLVVAGAAGANDKLRKSKAPRSR